VAIEIPYLIKVSSLINKHADAVVNSEALITPSPNDEFEVLVHLMGLTRLVEYNIRVSYEQIRKKAVDVVLPDLRRSKYDRVLKTLASVVSEKNKMKLLRSCQHISNGLVHSDFKKVYEYTKSAYTIDGIEFHHPKFDLPVIPFETTITRKGLNVVVRGDQVTATDSEGNTVRAKALIPDGTNDIHIDFKYLYQTGAFAFTFDVLVQGYSESVATMENLKSK